MDANYTDLITNSKVDLVFGPFSSLLTAPAGEVARRYGYAFVEGAGGSPLVFGEKLNNVFDVSLPVVNELDPFTNWIKSLPASQRPTTAAYPMANDPFATPQVQRAQGLIQPLGIKTVYSKIFPEEVPDYLPNGDLVAASKAQAVVLGSTDVPTVAAFMRAFEQQHYNPKVFIAAAGPDQGAAFTSAVGLKNTNGMMVPDAWYPGYPNATSQAMVNEYVSIYDGSPSDVNADVAEAYSVGEVVEQAIKATGGVQDARTMNSKIITYLHSGVTLEQRSGPGQVQRPGREHQGDRLHLPVAERQVRPGTAGRRDWISEDHLPEAELVELIKPADQRSGGRQTPPAGCHIEASTELRWHDRYLRRSPTEFSAAASTR